MNRRILVLTVILIGAGTAQARGQDSTASRTSVSAFIDAYYAYDFGRPPGRDRSFLTQAVRTNEFNLNLVHLALALDRSNVRAKLALQAGTSVQANFAAEPRTGAISGPELTRHIQEATLGVRAASGVWIDAGIYPSYIGWEGWVSATNPTYTRSLVAEFTPYFLSGARVTWTPSKRVTIQGHLMNGWQNVSENNDAKAVGVRVDYSPSDRLTLVYANYAGNEQPTGTPAKTRFFQQAMAKGTAGRLGWQAQVDYGREGRGGTNRDWYGWAAIGRWSFDPATALAIRIEHYSDPHQVIVVTGRSDGLVASSGSAGVDRTLPGGVLWRLEARRIRATTPLFADDGQAGRSKASVSLVTSLAVTF